MMVTLQPALELAGGPWYTDKELDTEFIKLLLDVCLKLVQERVRSRSLNDMVNRTLNLFPELPKDEAGRWFTSAAPLSSISRDLRDIPANLSKLSES